ncbi:hypothetical protein [uncultured Reyranella sp.]|uniref:hypothetical protein n=1 Tax=uncultured Reyranella sp. TaxID=735512 RepID=UPI0025D3627B|nr:hypothetical protein [uncultured Reyranella sp.]
MNTEVEKGCHVLLVDKRHTDCSSQMRAVIGTVLAFSAERGSRKRGCAMKRRAHEMAAGLAILRLLRQLGRELGASYRLVCRDLHIV